LAGLHLDIGNAIDRWKLMARKVSSLLGDAGNRLFTGSPTHHDIVVTGSCDAAMMFGSLSPNIGEDDVLAIAGKMIEAADSDTDHAFLQQLSMPVPLDDDPSPSWEQGYKLAMAFAEKIDRIQNIYCIDVAAVLEYLGIHRREIALSDNDIRAISLAGPRHKPTILLNTSNPTNQFDSGRRFTFAHELCHILYDRLYGRQLAMASGPWAPRDIERRANAFAAMFIMPIHLIREAFGSLTSLDITIQNIYEMADRMKASVVGVIDHLKNLGYIDNNTQDRLKEEAVKSYRLSEK
jgi:Zn-dependent peptidase ImmA (M78 family)